MNKKIKELEKKGFEVTTVAELLNLTPEESLLIEELIKEDVLIEKTTKKSPKIKLSLNFTTTNLVVK